MFIEEYNANFNSHIAHRRVVDTRDISAEFEWDVIERFNNGEIDLLIIDESMFTNPFRQNILGNLNKSSLNKIYLDCNLDYDLLFEALTMSNQVGNDEKRKGEIVIFRDLRQNIKNAIIVYRDDTFGILFLYFLKNSIPKLRIRYTSF